MAVPTSWFVCMNRKSRKKNGKQSTQFAKRRIIHAIEKYGVNTLSVHGYSIFRSFGDMTDKQIDIVMGYKPNLIGADGNLYWPGHNFEGDVNALKKILEYDTEYVYNTHPYRFGNVVYKNLLEFSKGFDEDDGWYYRYGQGFNGIKVERMLLSNHMNKWISLFNLMLDYVDLNDSKRRRFQ